MSRYDRALLCASDDVDDASACAVSINKCLSWHRNTMTMGCSACCSVTPMVLNVGYAWNVRKCVCERARALSHSRKGGWF